MNKYQDTALEVYAVIQDILYEAERGKISWEEAVEQMYAERHILKRCLESEDDDD